jgi:hypothetical protein
MTHFCPIRREGKSYWEVSGKSVLSLGMALGRNGWMCPLEQPQPEVEAKRVN